MTLHRPRHSLRRLQSLLTPSPTSSRDSTPPNNASNSSSSSSKTSSSSSIDSSKSSTSGLAWIILGAEEHSSTACALSNVIKDLLVPDLQHGKGIALLWHLHNTDPNARSGTTQTAFKPLNGGCCALAVQIHDITSKATIEALGDLPIQFVPPQALVQSTLPRELEQPQQHQQHRKNSIPAAHLGAYLKGYSLIQTYEAPKHSSRPSKGTCIVSVGISPAPGEERALDHWYRSEHLALMSENLIFIRCMRYRLMEPEGGLESRRQALSASEREASDRERKASVGVDFEDEAEDERAPSFLALHEYVSHQALLDHAIEFGQLVPETEMSRRVFKGARKVERTIWEVEEDYR
jgi:hypothetical protein